MSLRLGFCVILSMSIGAVSAPRSASAQSPFIRGDANADGRSDLGDALYMLFCDFGDLDCSGGCAEAGDVNDDGARDVSDVVALLDSIFAGGAAPSAPHDGCGLDPTPDSLGCASFAPCADPDSFPTSRGNLLVRPINHATLVLEWDGKTIYVDPVGGAARFQGFPAPDIVLVTDIHTDHMEAATLKAIIGTKASLVLPKAVSDALAGGVKAAEVVIIANGESKTVQGIEILAIPMYNTTPARLQYHTKGRGNGYVLDLAGTHVYLSGDTEDIPEMRELTGIDVAFLCMNLPYTMTPQQAASATAEFKPRVVYPYHYRGQDTAAFQTLVESQEPSVEVRLRDWYQ